jgi:Tetracyclin repressor-like, C-terminal domain
VEARAAAPLLQAAGNQDLARAVWAFAHGMVQLELARRFPPGADLDTAWQKGITAFQAQHDHPRPRPRAPASPVASHPQAADPADPS